MRTERVLYDHIYTKLEYQVQENADEMKQILEQMKKRITMRDKALDEVGTLRQQLLEATEALRKDKEEFDMLQIQFNEEDDERDQDQLSMQQDQHQQEATIHQSIEANLKQQQFQDEYDDDKMMDEAFAKVKQLTGIDNEDQLIVKLNQMEDLNFNRFHLTQELVAESDIMDSALQQASRELEMLQVSNFVDAEKSKEADMTLEKSELEIRIKDVELRYQEKSKEFEQIKGSIQTACSQLDVPLWVNLPSSLLSWDTFDDLIIFVCSCLSRPCHLIATNEITINNVMEYLAAIEKQAIDVIGTMRDFEDSEAESADPVKKSTDYVLLPNIEDIAKNGTKDEEDRPLTLQELQSSLKSHEAEGWVKKN